jgi:hypothetical protein
MCLAMRYLQYFLKVESGGALPTNLAELRVAFPGPAGAGLPLVLHVEVVAVRLIWRHFFYQIHLVSWNIKKATYTDR